MTGQIRLINTRGDEVIRSKRYDSRPHRKEIILEWKRQYGERFNYLCLSFFPDETTGIYGEDGINKKAHFKHSHSIK